MYSSALFSTSERHAAVDDLSQVQSTAAVEKPVKLSADGETHLALIGQLRVHDSLSPVYVVTSCRSKQKSGLRRIVFQIWWCFGRRFWPCAELDNEW